jgi:iron complex outermembrane recepter protein
MNPLPHFLSLLRACLLVVAFVAQLDRASAQSTGGNIEGRVLNTRNGEYLEKARVTVEGSRLETFTDSSGQYRLVGVPAGTARIKVFHTGLVAQTRAINVIPGQTAQQDFNLADADAKPAAADGSPIKLDQFIVSTSKEMDGAAIAINEQRFARNIVNVVAADEFGHVAEGNVGEFLKFLPGMSIDYVGGDARTISMGGVPSNNVPVSVGGFNLASAASSGTSRTVELEQVSINNIARIEVYHSPTPESPGSALAGGVNMVPRGAFERSRPQFNGSAYVMMRDAEKSLRKTPGPIKDPTYKIHPGFDFSYVVPVNKTFGFTLSGGNSTQYTMQDFMTNTWRGAGNATNVAADGTTGLPDTTPDKPYLTNFTVRDGTKLTTRSSLGTTIDYKLTRNDRLSFSFQYAFFDAWFNNRQLTFNITRVQPGNFDTRTTNGDTSTLTNNFGDISTSNGARQKSGTTYMPTLRFYHDGPIWKADAGAGVSHASNHYRDVDKGYFNGASARRTNVTVSFAENFYLRPGKITVTEGLERTPVDPYNLNSYVLNTASSDFRESSDLQRSAFANLRRDFSVRNVPLSVKVGAEVRESARDIRGGTVPYTFRGPDGRATSRPNDPLGSDDNAGFLLDEVFSQRTAPYGFPKIQYLSNYKYWELYKAHPEYFTVDENAAYRNAVNLSKQASEVISAAYFRGDLAFFESRLKFVGGIRAEQTNVKAHGPLTDPTGNYLRDASGDVVPQRDANGNIIFTGTGVNRIPAPVLIQPATINGVSNALAVSKLTLLDRQQNVSKEYLRWFPNINASYNFLDNLIGRVSYYYSVGRPDFNQYAGGLTLPDTELPPNSTSNRISVNNPGIKAWSAKTTKVRFEYYFERVGQVSIGAFRRDFENFFGSVILPATPEFLELLSLDPETYEGYPISTNYNLSSRVRMEGVEIDYKQALTFLPHWARGVQVFANTTATRATGDGAVNFSGYVPRIYNWGISLSRPKYNLRMNWNYKGRQRRGLIGAGRSIEPGTYDWGSKRLYIDLSGEYTLYKRFAVFANLRNIDDATEDIERHGPSTPAHAQFRQREDFGSLWTFGIKGTF